jgi:hypothetical protein
MCALVLHRAGALAPAAQIPSRVLSYGSILSRGASGGEEGVRAVEGQARVGEVEAYKGLSWIAAALDMTRREGEGVRVCPACASRGGLALSLGVSVGLCVFLALVCTLLT